MTGLSVIGKSVQKIEAVEKATGKVKYCSEEGIGVPGMLHAKTIFSPHAHAKIRNIDTSKAMAVKGVRGIFTGKDTPDHRQGTMIDDRHVICHETARFVGDTVAVVAADSMEAAEEAADLVKVEYEVLPAIFDVEEAMKPDCPVIVHPDLPNYRRTIYAYMGQDLPGPNVHTHHKIRKGDINKGFDEADFVIENRFQNDRITHCQLEPYNSVCYPEADGSFTMWTSARIYETLHPLLDAFKLPPNKLRVRAGYLGGMFGLLGRTERFCLVIAMHTGKPVKMVYSREECFIDGFNRLPKVVYVKDGVKKDGTLTAREIKVIVNTGAYTAHAPLTIRNGAFHASQYRLPNYKWDAYGVYTNEPCVGPLRGFGNAEVLWATERQMDMVAEKLGMDAVQFRLHNTPDENETDVRGQKIHCIGAKECLKKVAEWIEWDKPSVQPPEKHIKIAKGIAVGNKYTLIDTASSSWVHVRLDGTGVIEAFHGGDDCGQGLNTVVAQVVAEEFRTGMDKVKVVWGDSHRIPYDFGSASSRSTLYIGNAVMLACRDAKRQLFELAAKKLNASPEEMDIKDGTIYLVKDPEKKIDITQFALRNDPEARGSIKLATCLENSAGIMGTACFWGHPSTEDPETGQGERLAISYAYGAQAAEVAVDTETGITKLLRLYTAFDNGKTINPQMCVAQMEGGAAMGVGCALYEGYIIAPDGTLMNPNFHDYKIPSVGDMPHNKDMEIALVEIPHREGPYGAKGVSEAAMCPTAPAIGNAIYNATGASLDRIPMTPERVFKAIKKNKTR